MLSAKNIIYICDAKYKNINTLLISYFYLHGQKWKYNGGFSLYKIIELFFL